MEYCNWPMYSNWLFFASVSAFLLWCWLPHWSFAAGARHTLQRPRVRRWNLKVSSGSFPDVGSRSYTFLLSLHGRRLKRWITLTSEVFWAFFSISTATSLAARVASCIFRLQPSGPSCQRLPWASLWKHDGLQALQWSFHRGGSRSERATGPVKWPGVSRWPGKCMEMWCTMAGTWPV